MKTAPAPKTAELNEDETYRLAYVRLLFKKLKECKADTQPQELQFFPEDQKTIEYHAINVTRHAVSAHISTQDCVALFQGRIERLIAKDNDEWSRINDLITRNKKLLEQSDKEDLRNMTWYFLRKHVGEEV